MGKQDAETWNRIREFVRGDTTVEEFEYWIYQSQEIEALLEPEDYLMIISADYSDYRQVYELKSVLSRILPELQDTTCLCSKMLNLADIGIFEAQRILDLQSELKRYGPSKWWLSCRRCNECEQTWLVGEEARINDVIFFKRIDQDTTSKIVKSYTWPNLFMTYEELLRLGKTRGRSVWYEDPENSMELIYTIIDIAKERPDIHAYEFTEFLPIDIQTANALALRAIDESGVFIQVVKN